MLALFNEEQQMFESTAKRLAQSIGINNPHDLNTIDRAKGWEMVTEVGLLGLRMRDNDTPLASGVEVMIAAQALAERLVPQPFISSLLASELLALANAPGKLVEELAAGEVRYALLLTRDFAALAQVDDPDAVAFDCADAQYALALKGQDLVRVGLSEGFRVIDNAADLTRTLLQRDGVSAEIEVLGGLSSEAQKRWLALALTTLAADTVGAMEGAFTGAVAYTRERVQYGALIGSFQAIQHMCAEMLVQVQAAHSVTCYAAWAIDELPIDEALLAARTAKAYASAAAQPVTETVMQVYGGIGQTWEHIAHVYTRRALVNARLLGNASQQLHHIADARLGA